MSVDFESLKSAAQRVRPYIIGFIAVLALIVSLVALTGSDGDDSLGQPNFPDGGPAEFLYLDTARASAYLAQIDGGTFDSQKLTKKVTNNLQGKLALDGIGEAGGSKGEESFVEREVKATAASTYFLLHAALEQAGEDGLEDIELNRFANVSKLDQGQFVSFKTAALLSPIYVSPYLAVRHNSIRAIFPNSHRYQSAAEAFSEKVGDNPRVVFLLQPRETQQSGGARSPAVYMLPMNAALLTDERSLIRDGGGEFTVVGKVLRIFPEAGEPKRPAYVDAATRETWEQPLRQVSGELLCRTEPRCAKQIREQGFDEAEHVRATEKARKRVIKAMRTQTAIGNRGAVIIPVAIYK